MKPMKMPNGSGCRKVPAERPTSPITVDPPWANCHSATTVGIASETISAAVILSRPAAVADHRVGGQVQHDHGQQPQHLGGGAALGRGDGDAEHGHQRPGRDTAGDRRASHIGPALDHVGAADGDEHQRHQRGRVELDAADRGQRPVGPQVEARSHDHDRRHASAGLIANTMPNSAQAPVARKTRPSCSPADAATSCQR